MSKIDLRIDQYFSLFLCLLLLAITGCLSSDAWLEDDQIEIVLLQPPAVARVKKNRALSKLELKTALSAQSAIVIDADSYDVIFSKDSEHKLLPASTTKLMTALVAREHYETHQVITAGEEVYIEGTKIGIQTGESLSVKSLLAAILINSSNDAAMMLATHYPGGYQSFISQMNHKAKELNLTDTHFTNPVGFDHPRQTSSARDLAFLSMEIMEDSLFRGFVSQKQTEIFDLTGQLSHPIYNTNLLLYQEPEIKGIKTGTTDGAGEVLITWWNWQSHPLLIVIMGSSDRYQDTRLVMDWIKNSVEWRKEVSIQ